MFELRYGGQDVHQKFAGRVGLVSIECPRGVGLMGHWTVTVSQRGKAGTGVV